jgi:hypothetical protein
MISLYEKLQNLQHFAVKMIYFFLYFFFAAYFTLSCKSKLKSVTSKSSAQKKSTRINMI